MSAGCLSDGRHADLILDYRAQVMAMDVVDVHQRYLAVVPRDLWSYQERLSDHFTFEP